jgi:1,4-alpha-glucan branching enzyme
MGGGFHLRDRIIPKKDPATIAFLGHLLEKQGVQVALQALPAVLREVPHARLLVMGTGPCEGELRRLATRLGVTEHVEFTGFIDDFGLIQRRLAQSTIGVAPYLGELDRWTRYADPGKIKDYLAAGLPIVTTAVPPIARKLETAGAGVVADPTPVSVAAVLVWLLTDRAILEHMSHAALALAQEYDWNRIFDNAFRSSVLGCHTSSG